ncbi:MAG: PDZ domain-containing protein [Chloroflexota bacterium]|nr:PDZ domain-containing protein [Chloroflexota bacterium]
MNDVRRLDPSRLLRFLPRVHRVEQARSYLFALIALSTFLSIFVAAVVVGQMPYDGGFTTDRANRVSQVNPEGAAYRAGFRDGDVLVAIDGVPLEKISWVYRGKAPGDRVAYLIERGGERFTTSVVLTALPWETRVVQMAQLLVSLGFWAVSVYIWMRRPSSDRLTSQFFLLSQLGAGTLALDFLAYARWTSMFLVTDLAVLILPPFIVSFHSQFPQPISARVRSILTRLAFGFGAFFVAWTLYDAWADGAVRRNPAMTIPRHTYLVVLLLTTIFLIVRPDRLCLRLLGRRGEAVPESERVRRVRRTLITGLAGSLLPFTILSLLPEVVTGAPIVHYTITVPSFLLLPLSYGYALRSGELGRFERALNRSVVSFTAAAFLLAGFIVAWSVIDRIVLGSRGNDWQAIAVATLGTAVLFEPVRARVGKYVDNVILGGWYDYESVVGQLSAQLRHVRDLQGFAGPLFNAASKMRFRSAVLFWPRGEELTPQKSYKYCEPPPTDWSLPIGGVLHEELVRGAKVRLREDIERDLNPAGGWSGLRHAEKRLLREDELAVWVPLVSAGELRGVLILGKREEEHALEPRDLLILETVAGQATTAAENVALVQRLRERVMEVEEANEELALAKQLILRAAEDEQTRLSHWLHDEPVQDLSGARIALTNLLYAPEGQLDQPTLEGIEQVRATLKETVSKLRDLSLYLGTSDLLESGLASAIETDVNIFFGKDQGPDVHLELLPDGQRLSVEHRRRLFGVYREAVRNAQRHACASRVTVSLQIHGECAVLSVCDDGRGFRVPAKWGGYVRQRHLGMAQMEERVVAIGGRFHVSSLPGEGTTVRAEVPISQDWAQTEAPTGKQEGG